jgi:hypothetical protein
LISCSRPFTLAAIDGCLLSSLLLFIRLAGLSLRRGCGLFLMA